MSAQLPAGRDLDALVAELVFGYRRESVVFDYDGNHRGEVLVPPEGLPPGYQHPPRGKIPLSFHVPEYSTDINRAFRVIDAMVTRGWGCELATGFPSAAPDVPLVVRRQWAVVCSKLELPHLRAASLSDTLPHAVCLAAVAAIRQEQGSSRAATPS